MLTTLTIPLITWRLNGHYFFFFGGQVFFNQADVAVGKILHLFFRIFGQVLTQPVFLQLFYLFNGIATNAPDRDAGLLSFIKARFTNSFLLSSVRGGMNRRMVLPSFCGFTPRLALMMALSMGCNIFFSQGWMVSVLASITDTFLTNLVQLTLVL